MPNSKTVLKGSIPRGSARRGGRDGVREAAEEGEERGEDADEGGVIVDVDAGR